MKSITNRDDTIDTREVIKRIADIESDYWDDGGDPLPVSAWSDEDFAEHHQLSEMIDAIGEAYARGGVALIRENYLRDYIRDEYAELSDHYYEEGRLGPVKVSWDDLMSRMPFKCIDWDQVAEEGRSNYTPYEFDGVTYYYVAE